MTNRRYIAGRAYEYRVAKKLREEGWTVIRSAGSHSIFDLVAIKRAEILRDKSLPPNVHIGEISMPAIIKLIQCKSGKSAKRAIKAVVDSDIKRWEGLYSVSVEVV